MAANVRFRRLTDYCRHRANLRCECLCGHVGVVDAEDLRRWAHLHRWNDAIEVVRRHLYCSICLGRPAHVRPVREVPSGPAWAPKLEHDWARLTRRLRD